MRIAQKVAGLSLAPTDHSAKSHGQERSVKVLRQGKYEGFLRRHEMPTVSRLPAIKAFVGTRCCRSPTTRSTIRTPQALCLVSVLTAYAEGPLPGEYMAGPA